MNQAIALNNLEHYLVSSCDYKSVNVVKNYKFIFKSTIEVADMVIFSDDDRYDIGTSCIAFVWNEDKKDSDLIEKYKSLAAPIVTFLDGEGARIYDLRETTPKCNNISYKLLEQHFSINRINYNKTSLLLSKKTPHFQQLTLFSIDATKKLLVETFEQAILEEILNISDSAHNSDVIESAIYILAACILEDKLWPNESPSLDVNKLLMRCSDKYPDYFKGISIKIKERQSAKRIFDKIRKNLVFTTITHDMLGHFYEHAILDKKLRQELGIYWTDARIAKHICRNLPFESISANKRTVLDGTCGSASLLIGACERLDELLPSKMGGQERHDWLTERIVGVEKEKISARIAKLALLLYSIPYGNKWEIINTDFQLYEPKLAPHIIIANPPFKQSRKEEVAAEFMDKYLDLLAPGGIMAIILPRSYLEVPACKESRQKMFCLTKILEIWYLPEKVFDNSEIGTTVILLKKNDAESVINTKYLVKINEIVQSDLKVFLDEGKSTNTDFYNAQQWIDDPQKQISYSKLNQILQSIQSANEFQNVVDICQGIIPKDPEDFSNKELLQDDFGHWGNWLQSAEGTLEPYRIELNDFKKGFKKQYYHKKYIRYPGNHYQIAKKVSFDQPKIITNVARNSRSFWRIYGAIDTNGLYVSQRIFIFHKPKHGVSLEEIVAVINHPIANIFLNHYNRRAYLNIYNLKRLPFPNFSNQQKNIIIKRVQELMNLKKECMLNWEEKTRKIICELDDVVFDAYGVSELHRQLVKKEADNNNRPGTEWKGYYYQNQKSNKQEKQYRGPVWKISGSILSVNVSEKLLQLVLDGFDKDVKISIPATAPGWALAGGQDIEIEIPFSQRYETDSSKIDILKFRMLDYGYLSDDEIDRRLTEKWNTIGENANE